MSDTATAEAFRGSHAIAIEGLTKRYGALQAVDHLDLSVNTGETFALLGPNGAGKTSTIECCAGFRSPTEGSVRVLGLDPIRDARTLRPRIGIMLQEGGVYPLARPLEILRLYAALHVDPLHPEETLARVGLDDARATRFRDLSGGQKQRLSLAMAIIGQPELVFLDEPTAGLDPAARRLTWEHIRQLRADGVTVVLTTHLLDEAEALADRVAIIDRGRLLALGTPDELTHTDRNDLEFSVHGPIDTDALADHLGCGITMLREGRYLAHTPNDPPVVARLATWLAERDIRIGELKAGKHSLEDVFLTLTSPAKPAADAPHDQTSVTTSRRARKRH